MAYMPGDPTPWAQPPRLKAPAAPHKPVAYGAGPLAPKPLDYNAMLVGDPALQGQLGAVNAQGVGLQQGLAAARQRELIDYGQIPTNLGNPALTGNVGADITDTTRQLAQQGTEAGLSTYAQLQDAYHRAQSADVGSLAARGILHSGAYRQHSLDNLQHLQSAQYQAQQHLLDALAGLQQDFQGKQQGLATDAAGYTNDALQRIIAQINAGQLVQPTVRVAAKKKPVKAAPRRMPTKAMQGKLARLG